MKKIESQLKREEVTFGDPIETAKKIVDIAEQNNPTLRYPMGKGIKTITYLKNLIPWKQWEILFLRKLNL
jgi:hypothetical protein